MKKLSLILASALLLGGISFAAPLQAKKAPVSKTVKGKPATKKAVKKAPAKKGAKAKKAAK